MNLYEEIISLRLWIGPRDIFGDRIVLAFGHTQGDPIGNARDYDFDITLCEGVLTATIDIYSAEARFQERRPFDVDEWTDRQIMFEAPATRAGFRELSQLARGILGGRNVVLDDGTIIPGVRRTVQ